MKGAPERIIERSSTIIVKGQELKITEQWETQFNEAYFALGSLGERVLGFADLYLPEDQFPQGRGDEKNKNDINTIIINYTSRRITTINSFSLLLFITPSFPSPSTSGLHVEFDQESCRLYTTSHIGIGSPHVSMSQGLGNYSSSCSDSLFFSPLQALNSIPTK